MILWPLRDDQITETLRRHAMEGATVLGIHYDPNVAGTGPIVTVTVPGKRLVVPEDVLAMATPPGEGERQLLFERPA